MLFTEVSQTAGVLNVNQLEPTEELNIITYLYYYNGGGVAATDINGDDLPDLYFTNNQAPNRYYINRGDWTFEEATDQTGLGGKADWSNGVSVVDVNRDGRMDIYVCNVSGYLGLEGGNELFLQQADGTFVESAEQYGLDFEGFATQAYWFDYDGDGDLDCYLLCHSVHNDATYGPASFRERPDSAAGDRLYECHVQPSGDTYYTLVEDGDLQSSQGGTSTAKSSDTPASGIYRSKIGYGLSAAVADFNLDNRPDLYVCNDFSENDYLYLNTGRKDPIFREAVRERMGHTSNFSMGSDVGDFDNDGRPDLFTLDMRPNDAVTLKHTASADPYNVYRIKRELGYYDQFPRNNLQWNRGEGYFSEIGQQAGVAASDWSWSALAADFDLDGYEDIFVTNGIWRRPNDLDYLKFISTDQRAASVSNLDLAEQMPEGLVPNVAFHNQGYLTFVDVAAAWGLDETGSSNGSAYADFDGDGDLDLVVNNLNAPATLYRNNTLDHATRKTEYRTSLPTSTEYAQARIYPDGLVKVVWEDLWKVRWMKCLLSDGSTRTYYPGPQKGFLSQSENQWTFRLPEGVELTSLETSGLKNGELNPSDSGAWHLKEIVVQENVYTDFDADPLQPYSLSDEGPAVAKGRLNGREIVFVGGAHGYRLQLKEDHPDLPFPNREQAGDLLTDSLYEDVSAVFFDANGDGLDDLYVASGGGQISTPLKYYKDRLYLQRQGKWERCSDCLPGELVDNSSCVTTGDFDGDGDLDVFVGGRSQPGSYGLAGNSRLLLNDGKGKFHQDERWEIPQLGMVTAVVWLEEQQKLVVTGEWMPILELTPTAAGWASRSIGPSGLWRSLLVTEAGHLLAGNWGSNSALGQPDAQYPLRLYLEDLDGNGKTDPLITLSSDRGEVTLADKDEISQQLPAWRKNNLSYADFARRTFQENFAGHRMEVPLEVNELRSGRLLREASGDYSFQPFEPSAQITCLNDLLLLDDGQLLMAGNEKNVLPRIGRQDAAALQQGNISSDGLETISYRQTRLVQVRRLLLLKDRSVLVVGNTQ